MIRQPNLQKRQLVVRWFVLALLATAYTFLALRPSPQLATLGLLPRPASLFLDEAMVYRNLWAFGFLGLYAGTLLGVRIWPSAKWDSWLLTLAFLLAAPAKEVLQTAFPPRDGNLWGASLGMAGMAFGLTVGNAAAWLYKKLFTMRRVKALRE